MEGGGGSPIATNTPHPYCSPNGGGDQPGAALPSELVCRAVHVHRRRSEGSVAERWPHSERQSAEPLHPVSPSTSLCAVEPAGRLASAQSQRGGVGPDEAPELPLLHDGDDVDGDHGGVVDERKTVESLNRTASGNCHTRTINIFKLK